MVIDGYFLPASLPKIFKEKKQAKIPLLVGWNSAEIPGIVFMQGQAFTEANFIEKVKKAYPKDYEKVLQLYPHSTEKEVEQSATDLASENFITYSTWKWFDLQRKNSGEPVYRYLFSRIRPPLVDKNITSGLAGGTQKKTNENKMPPLIGAPHASEIEYCMGNLYLVDDYAWTDDDYKVSKTMQDFFANFIINGNPNGSGLPQWNAAKPDDPTPDVMDINVESKDFQAPNDGRFQLMDSSLMDEH